MRLDELHFDKRLVEVVMEVGSKDETLAKIIVQELIINPELGEKLLEMFRCGKNREEIIAERNNYLSRFYDKRSNCGYRLHATF